MNFEPILYGPLFTRDAQDVNLVAASADPVDVAVSSGGLSWTVPVTPVLTGGRYLAPLRMREILGSVALPLGLQDSGAVDVPVVTLSAGDASMSFRAIRGAAAGKTPAQLAGHWLSWRDQVSKTYTWGRERLTFLAGLDLLGWRSGSYSVSAKVYFQDADPVTLSLASGTLQAGCQFVTVDASFAAIAALVSGVPAAWDVSYAFSGTDSDGAAASIGGYPLRLVVARADVRVKEFVFCNGFGVEDRVYSSGRSNPKLEGASVAFLNGGEESELRNDAEEGREVYSGYLGTARESALWMDFLKAYDRRILLNGIPEKIVVDSQETDLQDNAIGSVKFTYHLAQLDAGRYFQDAEGLGEYDPSQQYGALYIGDDPASEDLPVEDLFFLKTRLDEFPAADLTEELLFLVQNPLTRAWGNVALSGVKDWLQQAIHAERTPVWSGPWEDYRAGVADFALAAALGKNLDDRIRAIERSPFVLPVATATVLGGIKVGEGLSIDEDGILSVASSGYIGTTAVQARSTAQALTGILSFKATDSAASLVEWDEETGAWHFHGHIFADGDVSGFYDGGTPGGGGGGDFDEAEMWIALGTTINVKKISSAYLPDITFPVTSVAGATGAVSTTQIADALTAAGYKLTDTVVTSLPWSAITGRPTKVSELTNDVGYITASALTSYATTAYTDAAQGRLARAIASNAARLDTLEDWLTEPAFSSLFADTLHARTTHTDEVRIGPLRLWYEDGAIRTDGHIFADGDVSGFYTGGTPGGGSGDFDEAQMWIALGTDTSARVIDASHIPSITTAKISNLENWIAAKGYVTSSGVTSVAMTVPTGFSVSGSPITSTGTLAISFASGYSLPTTAKQVNWDAAYTNNHTHANKTVLDGISSGKVTNWDTAFGWGNHASAGYLKSATAAATYETIANVAAVEARLARAIGQNDARITSLEDWLTEPAFGSLFADTLHARSTHTDEVRIGPLRLWYEDGAIRTDGHIFADGDVSGFYTGGTPGGGGGSDFDESQMWAALGTDISAQIIDASHIPSITTAKISNLENWIAAKGYVTSSGVTSVAMTVPTGFSVSGSPITSTGTLAISFASGYSLPTTAKQVNWDAAYTNNHTHANKTVLDGISSGKVTNWDTAFGWGNHASAGYLKSTTAASTYETIANVNAVEQLLARAVASNEARLDTIEAVLEEPSFQMLRARQVAANIGAFDEVRLGSLRLWFENVGTEDAPAYAIRTDGHFLAAGDVSGFYTGGVPGSGGGSSDFDESRMWQALGTTISAKTISSDYLPNTAFTLTGDVSGTGSGTSTIRISTTIGAGAVTNAMLAGSIAISKISGLQSALDGKQATISDLSTIRSNASNGATAYSWGNHASAGYLKSATAAATYETIANVDAVEARLARAIGQNDARITSLEDWLNEPTFQAVSAGTVSAFTGAFNTLDLSGVALSYTDAGVLQAAGSPLFSAFSSSGATVSATIGGQARSITLASITLNGVATALGGSFRTATITAGTAGQSSATSGVSFSIPYLTMDAYGVVTGYGTHTHSISAAQIVAALGATPVNRATADASGNTITTTYETIANVTAAQQRLARAIGSAYARLDTLEDAYQNGLFSTLRATTVSADNFFTRSHAWIGGNVNAYGDVGGFYGSDARLKDRVRPFSDAADILRRVQPVRFVWKPEAANFNPANTGEDFGVIAQDARAACPLLVREGQYGESDLLGADYGRHLPALLLGGWHDHERRIAALEKENAALKQKLLTAHAK